jgi:hypothetical protein
MKKECILLVKKDGLESIYERGWSNLIISSTSDSSMTYYLNGKHCETIKTDTRIVLNSFGKAYGNESFSYRGGIDEISLFDFSFTKSLAKELYSKARRDSIIETYKGSSIDISSFKQNEEYTYQWQYRQSDTLAWDNISGQTNSQFSIANSSMSDAGYYRCLVKDPETNKFFYETVYDLNVLLEEGLVGSWTFDGNANDISGHENHGTVNGATLTEDRFGNANSAYAFGGVDDEIDFRNILNNGSSPWTISLWMNWEESVNDQRYIFLLGNGDINIENIVLRTSWDDRFAYRDDAGVYHMGKSKGLEELYNRGWHHLTFVAKSDSVISYFIDGEFREEISANSKMIFNNIGNPYGGEQYAFHGDLDAISYYEKQLSNSEIFNLYKSSISDSSINLYLDESIELVSLNIGEYYYQWQYRQNVTLAWNNISEQTNSQFTIANTAMSDAGYYRCLVKDPETNKFFYETVYEVKVLLEEGLVGSWSFDGNANDNSGYENNGTVNGASLTEDRFGNSNSAYAFDGVDDYIDLNEDFDNEEKTILLTFKADELPIEAGVLYASDHNLIENGLSVIGVVNRNEVMELVYNLDGQVRYYPFNKNDYHQICFVQTQDSIKYIIDSTVLYEAKHENENVHSNSGHDKALLGTTRWFDRYFSGVIDQVKIYNRGLSNSEIFNELSSIKNNISIVNGNILELNSNVVKIEYLYQWQYRQNETLAWNNISDQTNSEFIIPKSSMSDAGYYRCLVKDPETNKFFYETVYEVNVLLEEGLVGSWTFDGNADDISGHGNHGTVNGATLTEDRFGNANSAYAFDGQSSFIDIGSINLEKNHSISAYVLYNNFSETSYPMGGVNNKYSHYCHHGERLYYKTGTDGKHVYTDLDSLRWYHIVLVREESNINFYVNGERQGEGNSFNDNSDFILNYFGRAENGNYAFNGKLDEIKLFQRILSSAEIANMATSKDSTVSAYNNKSLSLVSSINTPDANYQWQYKNKSSAIWSNLNGEINAQLLKTSIDENDRGYYRCLVKDSETNKFFYETVYEVKVRKEENLIGQWDFDGNADDVSGHENHGIVNGVTLTEDRFGNMNSAYKFDGNGFINIPQKENYPYHLDSLDKFTISMWFKADSLPADNLNVMGLIGKQHTYGMDLYYYNEKIWLRAGVSYDQILPNYLIDKDTWYHASFVYDSLNEMRYYVNGELIGTKSSENVSSFINEANLYFGYHGAYLAGSPRRFIGSLDDIRIYSKALSGEEIDSLYHLVEVTDTVPVLFSDREISTCSGGTEVLRAKVLDWRDGDLWEKPETMRWDTENEAWEITGEQVLRMRQEHLLPIDISREYVLEFEIKKAGTGVSYYGAGTQLVKADGKTIIPGMNGAMDYSLTSGEVELPTDQWTKFSLVKQGRGLDYTTWGKDSSAYFLIEALLNKGSSSEKCLVRNFSVYSQGREYVNNSVDSLAWYKEGVCVSKTDSLRLELISDTDFGNYVLHLYTDSGKVHEYGYALNACQSQQSLIVHTGALGSNAGIQYQVDSKEFTGSEQKQDELQLNYGSETSKYVSMQILGAESGSSLSLRIGMSSEGLIEAVECMVGGVYVPLSENYYRIEENNLHLYRDQASARELNEWVRFEDGLQLSPNGDGRYDVFHLESACYSGAVSVVIKDLQGNVVYSSTDVSADWDCRDSASGELVPQGSYTYQISTESKIIRGQFLVVY